MIHIQTRRKTNVEYTVRNLRSDFVDDFVYMCIVLWSTFIVSCHCCSVWPVLVCACARSAQINWIDDSRTQDISMLQSFSNTINRRHCDLLLHVIHNWQCCFRHWRDHKPSENKWASRYIQNKCELMCRAITINDHICCAFVEKINV